MTSAFFSFTNNNTLNCADLIWSQYQCLESIHIRRMKISIQFGDHYCIAQEMSIPSC